MITEQDTKTENKKAFGKIEKDIPIKKTVHRMSESHKLASKMEIGDSILFETPRDAERFIGVMRRQLKRATRRSQSDGTVRVWYIADISKISVDKEKIEFIRNERST